MAHSYGKKADLALSMSVKLARAAATFAQCTQEDIRRYGLTLPQFGALESLGHLGDRKGYSEAFRIAVYRMLPSNSLRREMMKNLKTEE